MRFHRNISFYEKYIKRIIDIVCSLLAILCFFWLYIIIAVLVRFKLGSPVLFKQYRPGVIKNDRETIFKMYKFRTMTDQRDKDGNLLPDEKRLTRFGEWLRTTSLDELPEAFCILKGDMSIIGPRPQLVRDMVFMSKEQRMRHTAKPGLSGLAQIMGRNAITWEDKLSWDLKYIDNINFLTDLKIVFNTIKVAFIRREGITDGENATALDYGDYLMKKGKISQDEYNKKIEEANKILSMQGK